MQKRIHSVAIAPTGIAADVAVEMVISGLLRQGVALDLNLAHLFEDYALGIDDCIVFVFEGRACVFELIDKLLRFFIEDAGAPRVTVFYCVKLYRRLGR